MIRSPIVKVLSTIRKHGVKALLMGGQACVFYGAAEFSKDTDIVLLAEVENLARVRAALDELMARQVYMSGLEMDALKRGHGVRFKCANPEAKESVSMSCRNCAAWIRSENCGSGAPGSKIGRAKGTTC